MHQAAAIIQIASRAGISPRMLGWIMSVWQTSGRRNGSFLDWIHGAGVLPARETERLKTVFRDACWECLGCSAKVRGAALVGSASLQCPRCGSHALKPIRSGTASDSGIEPGPDGPGGASPRGEHEAAGGSDADNEIDGIDGIDGIEGVDGVDAVLAMAVATTVHVPPPPIQSPDSPPVLPADAPEVPVVETLGRWWVLERAGVGGMAEVWKAYNRELGQYAAVKVLTRVDPPELRERFRREARIAASLDHPNIVRVRDLGRLHDRPAILMDWVEGTSLDHLCGPGMPLREAVDIGLQAARGLQAAHEAGVIHRDVKPGNILRSSDGHVKITDFGLALVRDLMVRLTGVGMILGTPRYMSPEQMQAGTATPACDIYALGGTLYHLLTGSPPFVETDRLALLHAQTTKSHPSVRHLRPDVPPDLERLLLDMGAREPAERPASMAAVADRLAAIARALDSAGETHALPASPGERVVRVVEMPIRPTASDWKLLFEIRLANEGHCGCVVDLSRTTRIDSAGISTLLQMWAAAANQADLVMASIRPRARIVLDLAGVLRMIDEFETVQEAVQHFDATRVVRVACVAPA